jgi:hypothetical protein
MQVLCRKINGGNSRNRNKRNKCNKLVGNNLPVVQHRLNQIGSQRQPLLLTRLMAVASVRQAGKRQPEPAPAAVAAVASVRQVGKRRLAPPLVG